jgi:hypothetical protein
MSNPTITPAILCTAALLVAGDLAAQAPRCTQDHPGRQHRAESVLKRGDARMVLSAGGHATLYALQRYGLEGMFTDAEIKAAQEEMRDFLNWRNGSDAANAAQFVTAGYEHYDRAYSDEAAAMLLGLVTVHRGKQPDFVLPPWMLEYVKKNIKDPKNAQEIGAFLESEVGIPQPFATQLAQRALNEYAKLVPEAVSLFMPKAWDVDNRLVEAALVARRNTATAGVTPTPRGVRVPAGKP